jgi:MFS family permease
VRPFGALVFGRIGDLVGRKYAFLVTLVLMGGSTALVGFLPVYASIGLAAPIALLLIRITQGLRSAASTGGAAVYVAEHVPTSVGASTRASSRSRRRSDCSYLSSWSSWSRSP